MPEVIYYPEYRIYKPKNDNNGAASKLQLKVKIEKYREVQIFWEASQQTGIDANQNASFAWDDPKRKVIFKLDTPDIGELLAVINGSKDYAGPSPKAGAKIPPGMYHQNSAGNTVMQFSAMRNEKNLINGYYVRLTAKRGDGPAIEVKHTVSIAEAQIIKIFLEEAVKLILGR